MKTQYSSWPTIPVKCYQCIVPTLVLLPGRDLEVIIPQEAPSQYSFPLLGCPPLSVTLLTLGFNHWAPRGTLQDSFLRNGCVGR